MQSAANIVSSQVEDCLYRVHRYHLERDSEYFRRLFLSRSVDDGRSDETAIPLPGVLQHEFDCLLHFLYYRCALIRNVHPRIR